MKHGQKIRWAGLFIAMLAALVARPVGATGSSHFKCAGWTVIPSLSPFTASYLLSVAAVSPTDIWAVGDGSNDGTNYQTLIEHWDGTSWQRVSQATKGGLGGVTALSASNVWAVGDVGNSNGPHKTLIEHWDGTQWKVIASPNGKARDNSLASVAAVSPSDIWAVGYAGLNFDIRPHGLIEHWNGTKWSVVPGPSIGSSYSILNSITAISSTDVWAVGYSINVNTNQYSPLSEHWNGTKWSIVPAPGTGNYVQFTAVTATDASHVWAVGILTNQGGTLLERWNGSRWHVMQSPPNSQNAFIYGIASASASNLWSVGGGVSTVTMHWNGTKWSFVPSPNGPYNTDNVLLGVTMVSARSVWAVGYSGDNSRGIYGTLIEHYC